MDTEIIIHVTDEERRQIETLAQEEGVGVDELVKRLVLAYVEDDDADEDVDVEAEFRQSWRESLAGNVMPIDTLWEPEDDG